MRWLPHISFLLYLLLCIFILVTSFRKGNKLAVVLCAAFLFLPLVIYVVAVVKAVQVTHPHVLGCLFTLGNAGLVGLLIVNRRKHGMSYLLIIPALVLMTFVLCITWFVLTFFEDKVLEKYHLLDDIYLYETGNSDNGYRRTYLAAENLLYIKRKIGAGAIDPWVSLENVKLVSLADSLLTVSYLQNSKPGTLSVDLRFDDVSDEINGVRIVTLHNKAGAIDSIGRIIIPIGTYEGLSDNYSHLMLAKKNGKWGYINAHNEVVIPFTFDGGGNFLSDSTTVQLGREYYYINKKGQITSRQKNDS